MSQEISSAILPPKNSLIWLNFVLQITILVSMKDFDIVGDSEKDSKSSALVIGFIFSVFHICSLMVGATMFYNIQNFQQCHLHCFNACFTAYWYFKLGSTSSIWLITFIFGFSSFLIELFLNLIDYITKRNSR